MCSFGIYLFLHINGYVFTDLGHIFLFHRAALNVTCVFISSLQFIKISFINIGCCLAEMLLLHIEPRRHLDVVKDVFRLISYLLIPRDIYSSYSYIIDYWTR